MAIGVVNASDMSNVPNGDYVISHGTLFGKDTSFGSLYVMFGIDILWCYQQDTVVYVPKDPSMLVYDYAQVYLQDNMRQGYFRIEHPNFLLWENSIPYRKVMNHDAASAQIKVPGIDTYETMEEALSALSYYQGGGVPKFKFQSSGTDSAHRSTSEFGNFVDQSSLQRGGGLNNG